MSLGELEAAMTQSLARTSATVFLDGFALSGLLGRARWYGAPALAFAPSRERSARELDLEPANIADAGEEIAALLRKMRRDLHALDLLAENRAEVEALFLEAEQEIEKHSDRMPKLAFLRVLQSIMATLPHTGSDSVVADAPMKRGF